MKFTKQCQSCVSNFQTSRIRKFQHYIDIILWKPTGKFSTQWNFLVVITYSLGLTTFFPDLLQLKSDPQKGLTPWDNWNRFSRDQLRFLSTASFRSVPFILPNKGPTFWKAISWFLYTSFRITVHRYTNSRAPVNSEKWKTKEANTRAILIAHRLHICKSGVVPVTESTLSKHLGELWTVMATTENYPLKTRRQPESIILYWSVTRLPRVGTMRPSTPILWRQYCQSPVVEPSFKFAGRSK